MDSATVGITLMDDAIAGGGGMGNASARIEWMRDIEGEKDAGGFYTGDAKAESVSINEREESESDEYITLGDEAAIMDSLS